MTSTDQPGELSQEELRAYLEQLREAEAPEIIVQAYTMLGTAAEVKLGRPDARVLIDAMAGMAQAVGSRLGEISKGMQSGVAQLQMAQVQAERQAAPAAGGEAAANESGQPAGAPSAGARQQAAGGGRPAGAQGQAGQAEEDQRATDRLWIPGRDPSPPRR